MFIPPGENIIETKKCTVSGEEFVVTDKDANFLQSISPVFAGKKYEISAPTLSPAERMRRRLSFRNERSLFLRKCDLTGKEIVSMYPSESKYVVYDKDVWYSDDWDPFQYGRDFDFNRPFFEQFEQLFTEVPRMARVHQSGMENSDFCNCASKCKNSYLCFSSNENEDCYYSTFTNRGYRNMDSYNVLDCENCYGCMDCQGCTNCQYVIESAECQDCMFCKNCVGCQDCLFSTNLRQGQYYIMNQQYSKEEYEAKKAELKHEIYRDNQALWKRFDEVLSKTPVKHLYGVNNENVSGNIINHSKNTHVCFECSHLEDCKYVNNVVESKDCMDYSYWGVNCNWLYEVMASGFNCSNLLFCMHTWENISKSILCEACMYSSELFACNGLRRQKNCVFNKSYSVSEYEELCGKIIDHMNSTNEWGEFFPAQISDFGYNETVAQDYFLLTESEAKDRGYSWKEDDETHSYHGNYHTPLPMTQYDERVVDSETAKKNTDACINDIHMCEETKKPFKIIKKELAFYIENHLPVPTLSPDARHKVRMQSRNPRTLHAEVCDDCQVAVQTSYDREKVGKILCEECYLTTTS